MIAPMTERRVRRLNRLGMGQSSLFGGLLAAYRNVSPSTPETCAPLARSGDRPQIGQVESAKPRKITELGGWSTVLNLGRDDANREASRREATELALQSRR
jgi:hypothetical protein